MTTNRIARFEPSASRLPVESVPEPQRNAFVTVPAGFRMLSGFQAAVYELAHAAAVQQVAARRRRRSRAMATYRWN